MAVKIRLARRGRKKAATYDIVVADARAPRDGRFIEKLGTYNPQTNPATINYDADRAFYWMMTGAQPTDTVRAMLSYRGVLYRRHLQLGVDKGAITQEVADQRFGAWKDEKDAKIEGKRTGLVDAKEEARKRWGWKKSEATSVVQTGTGWEITLWRLPLTPGGFVDMDISPTREVTATRHGY